MTESTAMARPPWPPHRGHAAVNIMPSFAVPRDMPRACLVSKKITAALLSTTRHCHQSAAMTKPAVTVVGGVQSSWSPFDLLAMAVAASRSSCTPPISGTAATATTPPLAGVRGPPPPWPANWSCPATTLTSLGTHHGKDKLLSTLIAHPRCWRGSPVSSSPTGARRGRSRGIPLVGHTHVHPVHVDRAKGKRDGLGPPKT